MYPLNANLTGQTDPAPSRAAADLPLPSSIDTPVGPKQLLFIGGDPAWFRDLEQSLSELRPEWSARHGHDRAEAKQFLEVSPCDVVVVHQDMPEAAHLVSDLQKAFPAVWAFSLQEECSKRGQGLAYEGERAATLNETAEAIVRATSVHEWSWQPALKNLLARIKKLPTLPRLHTQVTRELQSPNGSLELVSQYVRKDPVMAAKFLQVVNSAFFGLAYAVTDPGEAVMFLGVVRTRALILMAGVFSQFDELRCTGFSPEQIWQHSLRVASLAQGIALLQTEDPKLAEGAFTAGLVHDIGKLVLAGNVPEMFATACRLQQSKRIQPAEAELAILNTSHAQLGACLLGTWRLPLRIVEAVAWHHKPSQSHDRVFSVLTAVHAANVLAHETDEEANDVSLPPRFDVFYLAKLGLAARRNFWRDGCGLPPREEIDTFEDSVRRRLEAKVN